MNDYEAPREISFRAKDFSNPKKTVYGIGFYTTQCAYDAIIDDCHKSILVRKGSMRQMIYWDILGKEVYEGDTIIRVSDNTPIIASFRDYADIVDGLMIFSQTEEGYV